MERRSEDALLSRAEKTASFRTWVGAPAPPLGAVEQPATALPTHSSELATPADERRGTADISIDVSATQVRPDLSIQILPGITGGHRNPNLPDRHANLRADLQQLRPNCGKLCLRQFGRLQPHSTQAADQHIGHGR